jgi:hypothetical protein
MKNVHVLSTDKPSRLYQKENRFKLDTHPGIDCYISSASYKPVNIYITCDEEIKEGDLFYIKTPNIHGGNIVTKCLGFGKDCWSEHILTDTTDERGYHPSHCKKIILTTNQDLINDGVQPIEDDFLEWFVKNPSCEFVDTFIDAMGCTIEHCNANPCINYKIIIPTIQKFIEKHGITEQQLIDGYKQGLDLIFENASKIDKQETLEEAAILNCQSITHPYWDREKLMFIKGAKWQAERMYSEEEVCNIIKARENYLNNSPKNSLYISIKDFIEQYKKK